MSACHEAYVLALGKEARFYKQLGGMTALSLPPVKVKTKLARMISVRQKNRVVKYGSVLLAGVLLSFARVPILQSLATFLVVEDPLRPAQAIVALAGQTPYREMEAAQLYRAGWAPVVLIVRGGPSEESQALKNLGIQTYEGWDISREVLLRQGVPPAAILIPEAGPGGTLEELQAAAHALRSKDAPVILVTSRYHARRTRLTWNYVTEGRSPGIVRPASRDSFDPARWWRERQFILAVVREYLGLVNYYAGFPVGAGRN
jgi:uncharacterized SAM-binding protein YcdF (DUF218 family)